MLKNDKIRRLKEKKYFKSLKEFTVFEKLKSPEKIQDFLDKIPINFENNGETLFSPLSVIKQNRAHCMEGALLAAAVFWYHGERPLILDLKTKSYDDSHVVAIFKRKTGWGAISKTNHITLRYRDPIYRDVRELAMSYFNEYFLDSGEKTLRSFSAPFNLSRFGFEWLTAEKSLWYIDKELDKSFHFKILKSRDEKKLRPADKIEIKAGKLVEWEKKK